MTDKEQIIINGVDVSKCEYLTYELEEDGEYYWFCSIAPAGGPDECEYNPECFYKRVLKQLARKTQECEELKNKLACQININNHLADYQVTANKLMDCYSKALEEIGKIVKINCEEICGRKFEDCNDFLCSSKNILDIIDKTKGEENE